MCVIAEGRVVLRVSLTLNFPKSKFTKCDVREQRLVLPQTRKAHMASLPDRIHRESHSAVEYRWGEKQTNQHAMKEGRNSSSVCRHDFNPLSKSYATHIPHVPTTRTLSPDPIPPNFSFPFTAPQYTLISCNYLLQKTYSISKKVEGKGESAAMLFPFPLYATAIEPDG